MRLGLNCALALLIACGPSGGGGDDTAGEDADGDTISDKDEGTGDTDGDGTPDYLDKDSDNDTIPDSVEAGDTDLATPPVDSDADKKPDFRDLDSDANGRDDKLDGAGDTDSDTLGDYADPDDDGDTINDVDELGPEPLTPTDTDHDGTPDFRDQDSDDDTIPDSIEINVDYDNDGVGNFQDLDSDGDCIPDIVEAHGNPPADADGDTRYDFLDRDSDNDGLGDMVEDANCNGIRDGSETNATDDDTDNDGVSDLVEVAAMTNPNNPASNPQANGDYVFVVPYMKPQMPASDNLDFSTKLQAVDVYVLLDRSGSMSEEITNIRDTLNGVVTSLKCSPAGTGTPPNCIPDLWFGGGTIGYHQSGAEAFVNYADLYNATNFTSIPVNEPPTGCNGTGDCLEAMNFAAFTAMTGDGGSAYGMSAVPAKGTCMNSPAANLGYQTFGYGCFRVGALPVVMLATDEPPFNSWNSPTWSSIVPFYTARSARLMGVLGSNISFGTDTQLQQMATDTGATDANNGNAPLVFSGAGAGAAAAIGNGILTLANGLPLDLNAITTDVPGDSVDAVAAFLDHIETLQGVGVCASGLLDADSNDPDTFKDLYINVRTGTRVCWKVFSKQNTTVPATQNPQLFQARITVYGDTITQLDQRRVYFLVPPAPLDNPLN